MPHVELQSSQMIKKLVSTLELDNISVAVPVFMQVNKIYLFWKRLQIPQKNLVLASISQYSLPHNIRISMHKRKLPRKLFHSKQIFGNFGYLRLLKCKNILHEKGELNKWVH